MPVISLWAPTPKEQEAKQKSLPLHLALYFIYQVSIYTECASEGPRLRSFPSLDTNQHHIWKGVSQRWWSSTLNYVLFKE